MERKTLPAPEGRRSGISGLVVHAGKSEVESVQASESQSRRTFCVRFDETGKRRTFVGDFQAGGLTPQATGRRASLSAGAVGFLLPAHKASTPTRAAGASNLDEGEDSDSEEWDPTADVGEVEEDVPLDTARLSSLLASLRVHQMKSGQFLKEELDLIRELAETATEILAQSPSGDATLTAAPKVEFAPEPRQSESLEAMEAMEAMPEAPVSAPVSAVAQAKEPKAEPKARKSLGKVKPPAALPSLEKAPTAFRHFLEARSVPEIVEGVQYLLACVRLHQEETGKSLPDEVPPYVAIRSLPGLPWKATQVWQLLDAQLKKDDHIAKPLQGKSVVVVGAGPVGLRIALQLKLVGASVTVLEKRGEFVRINRLHLWDWVKQDLIQWGAKVFSPPGGSFGADKDYCHIGISELQYLLLKCCFLLGVRVELGVEFRDAVHKTGQGWFALTAPALEGPELAVDALLCCDGAASRIAAGRGAATVTGGLGKEGQAIGVVANFVNGRTRAERELRQFSWARQFNTVLFRNLKEKVGADLENIVYYRGDESHYMIMTPSKQCLVEKGCLAAAESLDGAPLLREDNVDLENLKSLAKEVAQHFGLPTLLTAEQSALIFDFSDTKRHEQAMLFQDADGEGAPLPISLAGDALLEPFWPTGLGCIRGFLGGLDSVACLSTWFKTGDRDQALAKAERAYRALKSVDSQTKDMTLKPDSEWRIEPATRYRHM
ncbi:unnamed protein product [Effrenium voratum]|nr:unnamed protein product [Effrenium voratum]